jgi:hypothetical protein
VQLGLSDDQEEFRSTVRRFIETECPSRRNSACTPATDFAPSGGTRRRQHRLDRNARLRAVGWWIAVGSAASRRRYRRRRDGPHGNARVWRPRAILPRMSSAAACQTNGLGSVFQCPTQVVMASMRCGTERNVPRRRRRSVSSLNHPLDEVQPTGPAGMGQPGFGVPPILLSPRL